MNIDDYLRRNLRTNRPEGYREEIEAEAHEIFHARQEMEEL